MTPVRVALSNDYEVVLHGLEAMLAGHRDQVEVLVRSTSTKIAEDVDLILYDTFGRLPADDAKLREMVASNDAKVVVYSFDSYSPDEARRQGAAGYIHKGMNGEHLARAIVALHQGTAWESETPAPDEQAEIRWPGQEHGLSERESETISFVARGLTNQDIAELSFLSINTVKTNIRTAYRKMGVERRSQAVLWALRNGFATDEAEGQDVSG
jgi:two-component system, NarL family, response regulator LiaR